jgi:recombinational DNA repair protein RecT
MKAFDKAIKLYASYTLLAQPADAKNIGRANTKLARFRLEIAKLFNAYLLPDRENIVYKTSYRSTTAHRVRFGRVTNPNHL